MALARTTPARTTRRSPHSSTRCTLGALETRNLASIIGADELSERDRRYLEFADEFDRRFVAQSDAEDRSIEATLNLAWELMSRFPRDMLTRISETALAKYHQGSV
jgi:V/A-type H+-transporting ATPase subunit B